MRVYSIYAEPLRQQQSEQYQRFRCIGAACEDTCCDGWQVTVDQSTYEKYQHCSHPVLGSRLQQWVQIQPAPADFNNFAKITLAGSRCPFLSEQLCSIHKELGEDHLGRMCATFPRIINHVSGVVEKSLDLSCPEVARLLLTSPQPAAFREVERDRNERFDLGADSGNPHLGFWEIRSSLLSLLQNRRYSVPQRLILAGHICEKLDELVTDGQPEATLELLEGFAVGIDAGLYDLHLQACSADASVQLSTVLELMSERIRLDHVSQRFLDLYSQFVEGLNLQPGLPVEEAGQRYAQAYAGRYMPFMAAHEYMLEHYLVYYAYKTLFPFGTNTLNTLLNDERKPQPFTAHYMLMAAFFAVAQSTMVGLAAYYGSAFGSDHVIRCLQSFSRTLEHCLPYPSRVLRILAAKGITAAGSMSILTQSPQYRRPEVPSGPTVLVDGTAFPGYTLKEL